MQVRIPSHHPEGTGHNAGPATDTAFISAPDNAPLVPIQAASNACGHTGRVIAVMTKHGFFPVALLFDKESLFRGMNLADSGKQVLFLGMLDSAGDLTGSAT
jgi:hypothetical protein